MRVKANVRRLVNKIIIPTGFQIERTREYLPFQKHVRREILRYSTQQRLTNDFLIRYAEKCDFLIDVGANRGTFTDHFALVAGPIPSILVEPIPVLADHLREKNKHKKNLQVLQCAISSIKGKSFLNITSNDGQSSSLLRLGSRHLAALPNIVEVRRIEVDVETLDNLCCQYVFNGAFLKIDVQGNELNVLEGSTRMLSNVNAIHIEVSIQSLYDGDSIGFKIWEFLSKFDFIVYVIDPWLRDSKANG
jgi:FkbM family methyltransferase